MTQMTRRQLCRTLSAVGAITLAGCSSRGQRHLFEASSGTLAELFQLEHRHSDRHLDRHVDDLVDELFDAETLPTLDSTLGGTLRHPETPADVRRQKPTYVELDGTYYQLQVADTEPTTVEAWLVWFEPVEEIPDDVEPVDANTFYSSEGYTDLDSEILSSARRMAMSSVAAGDDHAEKPPQNRGVVFFEPMSPDESEVVPDPPFEYGLHTDSRPGLPDEQFLRLRAEQVEVSTTQYTHKLEEVAGDEETFREHVESNHIDATFDSEAVSEAVREILDQLDEAPHEEDGNPSEGLETILQQLDLASVEIEDGETRARRERYYAYAGSYYDATYTLIAE